MEAIKNRYEFLMVFDVENGNPNGDPDARNTPRTDPETSMGFVTDVCLKRKIRNFIEVVKDGEAGYNILIKPDKSLNSKFTAAYEELGLPKKKEGKNVDEVRTARAYMCKNYFDVRIFGAVMNTGDDRCGIVRGPVQINFAKSIDRVNPQEITITRQSKTKNGPDAEGYTEMGKKCFIPYGLYKAEGYISALLAEKVTGFSEEDLELFWSAIINMFEHDRSASHGKMVMRKLYIFKHDCALGNAPANTLFEKIKIIKKENVVTPRSFDDYIITVDNNMPNGVEFIEKL